MVPTPLENDFSLLVVDMWWEEEIKERERGFDIFFNDIYKRYEKRDHQNHPRNLQYPYGSLHEGLDTIHDVVRMSHLLGKNIYGVVVDNGTAPKEELLDKSLHSYVPKENLFWKREQNAFSSDELRERLEEDNVDKLMVVGFDRDFCVLETIKGAINYGFEVITREILMLTCNREKSGTAMDYFLKNTTYLDSLVAIWNYLDPKGELRSFP